jgi:nucleotide-binding universal stress UspA family protein
MVSRKTAFEGVATMKSIIVHAHEDDAFKTRLDVALDAARAFDAHLTCLHITPYNAYVAFDPLGVAQASPIIVDELRAREKAFREATEQRLGHEDVRWDWASADGDPAMTLVNWAALADLVVLSQARRSGAASGKPLPLVDDVVVNAGCASLIVPPGYGRFDPGGSVVVGWNASEQAARAMRQALPLLARASAVHIVSVGEEDEDFPQTAASTYLSRHGIASELHVLKNGGDAGTTLHDFAANMGASALVIGAYGHSRLRETLLGGVTRTLTTSAAIPLVLGR